MGNVFLLTGDSAYQMRQERQRWMGAFVAKYGAENCSTIDGTGLCYAKLLDEVAVLPFTAAKRLVIVEGVALLEKEEVMRLPKDIHPDVLLLFVDPAPDRRRSAVKALLEIAEVRECMALHGAALDAWIRERSACSGAAIAPDALRLLLSLTGDDQMALDHEISKLAMYAQGRQISSDDVMALVLPSAEQNVWRLLDILATGDDRSVLRFVRGYLQSGESAAGLWPVLLWTVSQLTLVVAALEAGARTPQDVMKRAGMKFGTARSLLPLARRIDREALAALVRTCAQADIDLKTGVLRSGADASDEQEALIDLCLCHLAGKHFAQHSR
jgi:DNA polymerase III delta subunit